MLRMHHFAYHVKQTLSRRNTHKTDPKAFNTSSVSSWHHYVEHAMLALIASYGARKHNTICELTHYIQQQMVFQSLQGQWTNYAILTKSYN